MGEGLKASQTNSPVGVRIDSRENSKLPFTTKTFLDSKTDEGTPAEKVHIKVRLDAVERLGTSSQAPSKAEPVRFYGGGGGGRKTSINPHSRFTSPKSPDQGRRAKQYAFSEREGWGAIKAVGVVTQPTYPDATKFNTWSREEENGRGCLRRRKLCHPRPKGARRTVRAGGRKVRVGLS